MPVAYRDRSTCSHRSNQVRFGRDSHTAQNQLATRCVRRAGASGRRAARSEPDQDSSRLPLRSTASISCFLLHSSSMSASPIGRFLHCRGCWATREAFYSRIGLTELSTAGLKEMDGVTGNRVQFKRKTSAHTFTIRTRRVISSAEISGP